MNVNTTLHTKRSVAAIMDLFASEQLNGKLWNLAKQAAFMCFLVACALLGASLVLWQPGDVASMHGTYQVRTASPTQ